MNHITRMSDERICIAGIDPTTAEHLRPTTPQDDLITRALLHEEGGPLAIGAEVELGDVEPEGSPPEVEDHRFETANLGYVRDLPDEEFLELLNRASAADLEDAFGPALQRRGWKYAIDEGAGSGSLGVVRSVTTPTLEIDTLYGKKLQLRWEDPDPLTYLSVTDVRFYEKDHQTIREDVVEDVNLRLARGVGCWLMLGVARPWRKPGDTRYRHWLQLNGLVLDDRPVGEEP
jgi:hypothetical protein